MTDQAFINTHRRTPRWLWPNVLGLDAPAVAMIWLWAFAEAFDMALTPETYAALFLITWSLYVGDRLIDALKRQAGDPSPGLRSARHDFTGKHWRWLVPMGLLAAMSGFGIALSSLERPILAAGAMIGIGALAYFGAFVAPLGGKRPLPGKELAGGLLIAAGVTVPVFADYSGTLPVVPVFASFAGLCALNCLSLNSRDGDLPLPIWLTLILGVMLTLASAYLAWTEPALRLLLVSVSLSAGLLTLLPMAGRRLGRETFHALADLLMLTPLIVFLA